MALTVAPAKHVKMRLKNQASKIDGVMKISITKTVNKCLLLIDQFKLEQKYVNSPLIKQTASYFDIPHKKLIGQLTELEQSMQKYMILNVQAATGADCPDGQILLDGRKYKGRQQRGF